MRALSMVGQFSGLGPKAHNARFMNLLLTRATLGTYHGSRIVHDPECFSHTLMAAALSALSSVLSYGRR